MRLLFDENLSPGLVRRLALLYPGSIHARDVGLSAASDEAVWEYARREGYAIATKNDDFRQRSFLYGAPPKVIWLRLGNCTTSDIEASLAAHHPGVVAFMAESEAALLILPRSPRPH